MRLFFPIMSGLVYARSFYSAISGLMYVRLFFLIISGLAYSRLFFPIILAWRTRACFPYHFGPGVHAIMLYELRGPGVRAVYFKIAHFHGRVIRGRAISAKTTLSALLPHIANLATSSAYGSISLTALGSFNGPRLWPY